MPMGPEALMVRSKTDARLELAEFMRLEYARGDARWVEAQFRSDVELLPSELALAPRLRDWIGKLGPRRKDRSAALPDQLRRESDAPAGTSLAAMPAGRVERDPLAGRAPLAAAPILTRV
jgi:hypothetical protein